MKKEITKEMIENFESQNQVSVIINGVRYDAVDNNNARCKGCDMYELCSCLFDFTCSYSGMCDNGLEEFCFHNNTVFKKSNKSFEI